MQKRSRPLSGKWGSKPVSVKQEEDIILNDIGFGNVFVPATLKHRWHHNWGTAKTIIFSSAVVAFLPPPLAFFSSTFWQVINHAAEECMSFLFVFNIDLSPRQPQTTKPSLVQIVFLGYHLGVSAQGEEGHFYCAGTTHGSSTWKPHRHLKFT